MKNEEIIDKVLNTDYPEIDNAPKNFEGLKIVVKFILKEALKLNDDEWLNKILPEQLDVSLKKQKERILKKIDKEINSLNKKENYSVKGDKKFCCQAQLIKLKKEIENGK